MTGGATARKRGRPPRTESADTRDRILTAAREEFSERGYEKTSVRGIAKAAGVDSALVHHYFGTKEQVFEAAIEVAAAPALGAGDAVAEGPLEGVGERLTRFVFGVWENPATRTPLLAIVRSAVNNETAAAVFRRIVASQLLRRIAAQVDLPDAELRAELAAAQLVGTAMLRYVIKVEPLASADVEQIIARVAPVVQGHLTNP
ncbi:TetR family transcriptional regulator [Streptomyces sp. RG80]|uniref:TetR/AcrR family transcriptional regulator n=1 Tax=Streptomyces sp. RG80 TaxID=3157340 RepID=UPI00338E3B93